jgi:predicted peroxiredoxin
MAKTVQEDDFPNLKEIMKQAMRAGVKPLVCEQSTRLLRMERGNFVPVTKIGGANTLND